MKFPSFDGIKEKFDHKTYKKMAAILFPVLIVIFGMCRVFWGIDITDTAYNYGNFVYLDGLDEMWYCSTFLANILGRLFTFLPFGHTLLALNIYTGLVKCGIALVAYYYLTENTEIPESFVFFGEIAALGLCWCPTSLLYNYLSYFLFIVGAVLLYHGLVNDENKFLFAAGVVLGLNIFTRFPNLCEAGLIVALWYYCIIERTSFKKCAVKTGMCILGYMAAVVVMLGLLALLKGPMGYVNAIKDLFSMTDEASQYSGMGMIYGIYYAYRDTLFWIQYIVVALAIVFGLGFLISEKYDILKYIIVAVLGAALVFVLHRNNLFTFNYSDYTSVYNIGAVMLVIMLLCLLPHAFMGRINPEVRLLCVMSIGIVLITPLGTNNAIYASLNNLFLVFPVFFYVLSSSIRLTKHIKYVRFLLILLTAVYLFQIVNFGIIFQFRDGQSGEMDTCVSGYPTLSGMKTQTDNALRLEAVNNMLNESGLKDRQLLLYGDVPGMAFYLEMKPAISSTWPSLDSYNSVKFANEMDSVSAKITDGDMERPVIMTDEKIYEHMAANEMSQKESRLKEFMDENGYEMVYSDGPIVMYFSNN